MKRISGFDEGKATRYLIRCIVYKHGNAWTMNSNKGGTRIFNGSIESFAKFLQKIKAKDNAESPKSYRSMTYMRIAQEIASGKDKVIFVWSNYWPKNKSSTKVIFGEDETMKRINEEKLTEVRYSDVTGLGEMVYNLVSRLTSEEEVTTFGKMLRDIFEADFTDSTFQALINGLSKK